MSTYGIFYNNNNADIDTSKILSFFKSQSQVNSILYIGILSLKTKPIQ